MNLEIFPLFSSPIVVSLLEDSFDTILEDNKLWEENNDELCKNNYISSNQRILNNYLDHSNILLDYAYKYLEAVWSYKDIGLQITTSWLTKTITGGYSRPHAHYNSLISGVYYFDEDPEGFDGKLIFTSPTKPTSFYLGQPEEFTILNSPEWSFTPRKGQLVLFPSYLSHRIGLHSSSSPRHSLAFNVHPVGKIGGVDSFVEIFNLT